MGYFETADEQQLSGFMSIPDVPEATVWHKADIRLQQTILEMHVTHWQLKCAALTADTLDYIDENNNIQLGYTHTVSFLGLRNIFTNISQMGLSTQQTGANDQIRSERTGDCLSQSPSLIGGWCL